jgi:hypothetical protein
VQQADSFASLVSILWEAMAALLYLLCPPSLLSAGVCHLSGYLDHLLPHACGRALQDL